ncbi:hypothetical protein Tco_0604197 [Tanacetum coccineum]
MSDSQSNAMCCSDDDNFDLPLIYHVNGHSLHFRRREFCLLTSFKFGSISFREYMNGDIPFRNRLFPEKIGYDVKIIDLFSLFDDEEKFSELSDEDAIRLCLLLSLEIWIIKSFCLSDRWWTKVPKIIPRALSWRRKAKFNQSPPVFIGGLYGEYLNKRSATHAAKKKSSEDFHPSECVREASIIDYVRDLECICETLLTLPKESTSEDEPDIKDHTSPKEDDGNVYCCDDNGDVPLFFMPAKLVSQQTDHDLSSDLSVLNGFCNLSQTREEKGDCEVAEQKIQYEIQRLYNHREARLNKIAEDEGIEKLANQKNVLNPLMIEKCKSVKPWIEDSFTLRQRIDKIFWSYELSSFELVCVLLDDNRQRMADLMDGHVPVAHPTDRYGLGYGQQLLPATPTSRVYAIVLR